MPVLTEQLKKKLTSLRGTPSTIEIEKGMIRDFAAAVEDGNPLWQSGEHATEGPYKGMISPPSLFHAMKMMGTRPEVPSDLPLQRKLDGGGEWEFLLPVRPGDILTVTTDVADATEKEGSSGVMVFLTFETRLVNQRGQLVAKSKAILIMR